MSADALLEAYRTTRFIAYDGDREVVATIAEHAPAMDELLRRLAARSGVFITAWNPRSVVLSPEIQCRRRGRLEARVAAEGIRALPHRGISADPSWHPEEGLFVLDIDFDYAIAMATDFGQNAITAVIDRLLRGPPFHAVDGNDGGKNGCIFDTSTAAVCVQPLQGGRLPRGGCAPMRAYRDLGMAEATNGLAVAHVIRFLPPCTDEVRQWHTHDVQFQMVYVLRRLRCGWKSTDSVLAETMQVGQTHRLQPPKIRHRVLDYADDCESTRGSCACRISRRKWPEHAIVPIHCPRCGDILREIARASLECLRGQMPLSRELEKRLQECYVDRLREPRETVFYYRDRPHPIGGAWFLPGMRCAGSRSHARATCAVQRAIEAWWSSCMHSSSSIPMATSKICQGDLLVDVTSP